MYVCRYNRGNVLISSHKGIKTILILNEKKSMLFWHLVVISFQRVELNSVDWARKTILKNTKRQSPIK